MKTSLAKKLTKLLVVITSITTVLTFFYLMNFYETERELKIIEYVAMVGLSIGMNLAIFTLIIALIWANIESRKMELQNERFFYFYNRYLTAFENNDIDKVKLISINYFSKIKKSSQKNPHYLKLISEIDILYQFLTTKNLEIFKFK